MSRPIYLDYAATTPVDPRVAERMSRCLLTNGAFGNPSSRSHVYGWEADELVEIARQEVAELLNCDPREIFWTSGATEADNLAIKGIAEARRGDPQFGAGRHIITSMIEHKAVLDSCQHLETQGYEVTYLRPTREGWIEPAAVAAALRPDTVLVSIMHANNEIGVLNDIAEIGQIVRASNAAFHVDAAQSLGKVPIDLAALPVDLMSFSAHKLYGPKGMGALYVRRAPNIRVTAQIHGGGQERGVRSGTLATHQIVGFGEACRICRETLESEALRLTGLRDRLWRQLAQLEGVRLNGDATRRLPALLNVAFAGVDGETLMAALIDVAVSNGSACSSVVVEPSSVLRAIGLSDELAHASVRMTVGRFTSDLDIERAGAHIVDVVNRLREVAPKPA